MSIAQLVKRRDGLVRQREKAFDDGRKAQARVEALTDKMKALDAEIKTALDKSTATAKPAARSVAAQTKSAPRTTGKRRAAPKAAKRTAKKAAARKAPARKATSKPRRRKGKKPIADVILNTLSKEKEVTAKAIKDAVAKAGHSKTSVSVKLAEMKKNGFIASAKRGLYRLPV